MAAKTNTAADVLEALDEITGGRVIKSAQDAMGHPFVVTKTSHIPGSQFRIG